MRRRRVRVLAASVVALALAGAVVGLVARHEGRTPTRSHIVQAAAKKKSYAQLVAGNYKVLTPKRTTRLLRFADAAYACLSKQLDLGKPRPQRTKIVMALGPRNDRARGGADRRQVRREDWRPTCWVVVPGARTRGHRLPAEVLHPRQEGPGRASRGGGVVSGPAVPTRGSPTSQRRTSAAPEPQRPRPCALRGSVVRFERVFNQGGARVVSNVRRRPLRCRCGNPAASAPA